MFYIRSTLAETECASRVQQSCWNWTENKLPTRRKILLVGKSPFLIQKYPFQTLWEVSHILKILTTNTNKYIKPQPLLKKQKTKQPKTNKQKNKKTSLSRNAGVENHCLELPDALTEGSISSPQSGTGGGWVTELAVVKNIPLLSSEEWNWLVRRVSLFPSVGAPVGKRITR